MSRVPLRTALALRRRPRRARWSPWRRTLILQWTVGLSCAAVVAMTIARGIIRG
jgi:hypothetical protein